MNFYRCNSTPETIEILLKTEKRVWLRHKGVIIYILKIGYAVETWKKDRQAESEPCLICIRISTPYSLLQRLFESTPRLATWTTVVRSMYHALFWFFCLQGSLEVLWRGRPECVGVRLGVDLTVIFGNPCVYRPSPRLELLGDRNVCIMGTRLERDMFLTSVFQIFALRHKTFCH